jgi:hypothetical protein
MVRTTTLALSFSLRKTKEQAGTGAVSQWETNKKTVMARYWRGGGGSRDVWNPTTLRRHAELYCRGGWSREALIPLKLGQR